MMTVAATFFSLVPILWSTGTGSDVMRRIAAPMVGGVFTSFVAILLVFPSIYFVWRGIGLEQHPTLRLPIQSLSRPSPNRLRTPRQYPTKQNRRL